MLLRIPGCFAGRALNPCTGACACMPRVHCAPLLNRSLPCPVLPPPHHPRWQLPTLVAITAVLLAHTQHLCSNGLLQHGWTRLRTAGRILLPLVAPAFMDLMPQEGIWALAAPAPPASEAAAAQCVPYQASSVLLAAAALSWQLWCAERRRCKNAVATAVAARQV